MKVTEEVAVSVRQDAELTEGIIARYYVDNMEFDGMYLGTTTETRFFETVELHDVFLFDTGKVEKFFAFEFVGVLEF